jgi:hypothetical protein
MKKRYNWRYTLHADGGKLVFSTSTLHVALSEAKAMNLELRQKLPDLKIGKRILKNRYKVLRHITNQMDLL